MKSDIEIDGSFGEGGGQILRTAISLSLLTGRSFRIFNLRAGRQKPGLRPQHLAAVKAAQKISGSEADGATVGSSELLFFPRPAAPGDYRIDIGTAGSTSLVFQTLLPALLPLDRPSRLSITGGTHNPKSPCFDFIKTCFLPLLSSLGILVEPKISRHGFFPRGQGEVSFTVHPWKHRNKILQMSAPAEWQEPEVKILLAGLEMHIAEREQAEVVERLAINPDRVKIDFLPSDQGPGNTVLINYLNKDGRTEIFTGYGEPGKRAERVASEVCREAKNFSRSKAQLDPYLADQVLLYLATGGGEFTTNQISSHFRTNLQVIREFGPVKSELVQSAPDLSLVKVCPG
jgi:RNA 3'-terminal phosphate cyclase (ATP)